jgi:hypothetical protein
LQGKSERCTKHKGSNQSRHVLPPKAVSERAIMSGGGPCGYTKRMRQRRNQRK